MSFTNGFRNPRYVGLFVALATLFMVIDTWFDLREGGKQSSLATTRTASWEFYQRYFGTGFVVGSIVLNVLIALLTATLLTLTIANFRQRRATGAACSTAATVLLGFTTFGCPGCLMPLAGSLGASFFAKTLPFFGLEFKVASLTILLVTLVWTIRRAAPRRAIVTPLHVSSSPAV